MRIQTKSDVNILSWCIMFHLLSFYLNVFFPYMTTHLIVTPQFFSPFPFYVRILSFILRLNVHSKYVETVLVEVIALKLFRNINVGIPLYLHIQNVKCFRFSMIS